MDVNRQPRLPEVERFVNKVQFLNFMKTLDTFDYVYKEADIENLRSKLERLKSGRSLLDDPDAIAIWDRLVIQYRYFLKRKVRRDARRLSNQSYPDPDELVREHEDFLRAHLKPRLS